MPTRARRAFSAGSRLGAMLLLAIAGASTLSLLSQKQKPAHTAPLELIHDKPYVSVTVNGHGPYRFLIDTGTGGQALVSPELASELSLPVVGHARLTDPTGQGKQRSEILLLDSLQIAGLEFKSVRAVSHRLYSEEENCQGVLGFILFKDYLFTLDFPGRTLILASGSLNLDASGTVLPFRMPEGFPVARIRIGSQHLEAQIDSGGKGLSMPAQVAGRVKFLSTPIAFGSGESLATRFQIKAARLQPDVRLGRYTFRQAFVEINPAFPLVNVGSTPLKNFIITFDQTKLLMQLYSSQKTLRLDASPATIQLLNEPRREASDGKLVPVG